jgi:SAM-dependent methyltransferase
VTEPRPNDGPAYQDRARALSFGEDAEAYDRARPGYPPAVYDAIFALAGPRPSVVELGAGTGKATVDLARRGARIVAIEPSPEMARVLRRNTAPYPDVRVVESDFENWDDTDARADLVVSAQAWHWIDPAVALPKVRRLLRPGGALAFWWNRPRTIAGDLWDGITAAYQHCAPELAPLTAPNAAWATTTATIHRIRASSLFTDPELRIYEWQNRQTAQQYADWARSLSAHRSLAPEALERLMAELVSVIDRAGGELNAGYQTDLVIARPAEG